MKNYWLFVIPEGRTIQSLWAVCRRNNFCAANFNPPVSQHKGWKAFLKCAKEIKPADKIVVYLRRNIMAATGVVRTPYDPWRWQPVAIRIRNRQPGYGRLLSVKWESHTQIPKGFGAKVPKSLRKMLAGHYLYTLNRIDGNIYDLSCRILKDQKYRVSLRVVKFGRAR